MRMLLLVATVAFTVGCSDERKTPKVAEKPLTEAQLAAQACASDATKEHIQSILAISKEEISLMSTGSDYSATLFMRRREKETYCMNRVSCYNLSGLAYATFLASCLDEKEGI